MAKKIFCQCSNCGFNFDVSPMLGIPEGMFYEGYRAVGNCVKTWKDRNGKEFEEQIENPSKQFANWWNDKVKAVVTDESRIKKYRINNGVYEEVTDDE